MFRITSLSNRCYEKGLVAQTSFSGTGLSYRRAARCGGAAFASNVGAGYQWRNVPVYGGGFVPGIIYNQGRPGGLYLRTNVGGTWRWNASTGQWIPLTDFFGQNKWYFPYILSLAT